MAGIEYNADITTQTGRDIVGIIKDVYTHLSPYAKLKTEGIKPGSHLRNDVGFDSLDDVAFMMAIEKRFDLCIPDEDAESILTVGDAMRYVDENTQKKG